MPKVDRSEYSLTLQSEFDEERHWVATKTPDGLDLIFITGTAGFYFKGSGSGWRRATVLHHIPEPLFRGANQASAMASLGAIYNAQTAVNAGWATDWCDVTWDFTGANPSIILHVGI